MSAPPGRTRKLGGLTVGRLGAFAFLACLLLLPVSCGAQAGTPQFQQAFGIIDSPCGAAAQPVIRHCTAHVLITNKGGEGVGHTTVVVHLKDPQTGSFSAACGRSIPDTPNGGYSDLPCSFDIPPGDSVDPIPVLQSIDYAAAVSRSSSGFDFNTAGTLILAGAALLLAIATSMTAMWRRQPAPIEDAAASSPDAPAAPAASPPPSDSLPPPKRRPGPWESDSRDKPETDYDIPPLPR